MSSKVTSTGALDNLFHGTFRINFPTELNFIFTGKSRDSIILGFNWTFSITTFPLKTPNYKLF